ncbi:hypothetical protein [Pararobbsia silviterrae]|nr:hypothetical protein [Pararobbsia silviterrae]
MSSAALPGITNIPELCANADELAAAASTSDDTQSSPRSTIESRVI